MKLHILNEKPSILNHFLADLRNIHVQNDRQKFRINLERIGELLAYEISKALPYKEEKITTPLGSLNIPLLKEYPVLATILRAGLPLHHGLTSYFDKSDHAYISAYRKHITEEEFEIDLQYFASPSLQDKILILADPMLASGHSIVTAYNAVLKHGTPKELHIACVIASQPGVDYVMKHLPENTQIWIGAVDAELNHKSYIVPGLGDAGDLAFGEKL